MATNDFLPFCPTDTGTNLEEQADYIANPQRLIGNQSGVARSKLVNKALRQSTYIASCLAQYMSDITGDDVLDDATPSEILATMALAFNKSPTVVKFLTGSGTYTPTAGTSYIKVKLAGAGGGGASGGDLISVAGSSGGTTSFGSGMLSATGGQGGPTTTSQNAGAPSVGGTGSLGSVTNGFVLSGGGGQASSYNPIASDTQIHGGQGGSNAFGGAGAGGGSSAGGAGNAVGLAGAPHTGAGGGGGGTNASGGVVSGAGGAAGGYVEAIISPVAVSYPYAVGAGGAAGAGTFSGGAGAGGQIIIEEY